MTPRAAMAAALAGVAAASAAQAQVPSVEGAREIARDAYVYAYPMVENYLSIHAFALDEGGPDHKGPPNAIHSVARVFTPSDRGVVTPNSDTPYSFLIMDLRAEPLVVTLPAVEPDRYQSLQLVDLYSHNVDYIGTRKDGNDGGDYLIAGPGWSGDVPEGIERVVKIPTEILYSHFRTQLFGPDDLARVKEIQAGYAVQPLSRYAGTPPPPPAPPIDWPEISRETAQPEFWSYANFLLRFAPPLPWEEELRDRFARIGVAPAEEWPATPLAGDVRQAVIEAGDAAREEIATTLVRDVTSSRGLFGSPEAMRGRYMQRALGAMGGLYGLEEKEALYVAYQLDEDGERLDASKRRYRIRFEPGALPPAGAFWSLTMYDGDKFLVENPLDRYLINSAMLPQLERAAGGGLEFSLQHDSPGEGSEDNWLPAPDGEMSLILRIYMPEAAALEGGWEPPRIEAVE